MRNHAAESVLSFGSRYAVLSGGLLVMAIFFSILPNGLQFDDGGPVPDASGGNILRRFQWSILFLVAGYILWRRRTLVLQFLREVNPFLLAFMAYVLLNVLWSTHPGVTLRKDVLFFGLVGIGMAVQLAAWYPNRLIHLLYIGVGWMLLASLFAGLFLPGIGREPDGVYAGLWRGIRETKNLLANLAAVGVLLGAHGLLSGRGRPVRDLAYLSLALFLLLMSQGKTSLISLLLALPLMWALARPPLRSRYWLPVSVFVAAMLVLLPLHFYIIAYGLPGYEEVAGATLGVFGKDASLTNRDIIWIVMWPYVEQHWLFGYGFGAFWLGDYGDSGEVISQLGWTAWQSHNGYLDLLNEVGVVGCLLVVAFLVYHLLQLRRLAHVDRSAMAFHAPLLLVILASNLAESSLFNGVTFYSLLVIFSSLAVSRRLWQPDLKAGQVNTGSSTGSGYEHDRYASAAR